LLKKPKPPLSPNIGDSETDTKPPPKSNPFLPPNPDLFVSPVLDSHYVVLNKFPVIPGHLILATNDFKQQTHPLTLSDFEAVLSVLRQWDDAQDGGRIEVEESVEGSDMSGLYGFFNSGEQSGASQPHRHIQWIPMKGSEVDGIWPSQTMLHPVMDGSGISEQDVNGVKIRYQTKIGFKHFIAPIPNSADAKDVHEVYHLLLSLARKAFEENMTMKAILHNVDQAMQDRSFSRLVDDEDVPFSYNLAFNKRWIAILPRTAETTYILDKDEDSGVELDGQSIKCPGLNLNGTILAGMCLIRTKKELEAVLEKGTNLKEIIGRIGVAMS
jgi:sulfate adenylyltransferase (ADP) / ATP adenylyltransferase